MTFSKRKNNRVFFYLTGMFFTILALLFFRIKMQYCDHPWFYVNSLQIANGKHLYSDLPVVAMPLAYWINALALKINESFFSMVVVAAIETVLETAVLLLIARKMGIKEETALPVLYIFEIGFGPSFLEYNRLVALFSLVCLYILMKLRESKHKRFLCIFLGVIVGGACLSKQTTGACLFITTFLCLLVHIKQNNLCKKHIILFVSPILIECVSFLLYLVSIDSLCDFYDCCILAGKSFSQNFRADSNLFFPIMMVLYLILLIIVGINAVKNKNLEDRFLIAMALPNLVALYPIANTGHLIINLSFMLLAIFRITKIFHFDQHKMYWPFKIMLHVFIAVIVSLTLLSLYGKYTSASMCNGKGLQYIQLDESVKEEIEDISSYEKKHNGMKFYSPEVAYCLIELEQNRIPDKYWISYLTGNLGTKDPIDIIRETEKNNQIYWYIYKDDRKVFYQTPTEARDYIKKYYKKIDETKYFEIYKRADY